MDEGEPSLVELIGASSSLWAVELQMAAENLTLDG